MVKNLPAMWETWVWSLGWEDPLEEGRATHSSILAWIIPWTEEPDGLQSMGLQSWVRLKWLKCAHARMHTHTHTHRIVLLLIFCRNATLFSILPFPVVHKGYVSPHPCQLLLFSSSFFFFASNHPNGYEMAFL